MKPIDKIEQLKVSTYHMYKQEDGIPDMTIGLVLLVLGLNNPFPLIMLVFNYHILVSMLKKKLIYPRVGFAVFYDNPKQNHFIRVGIYILFMAIGIGVAYLLGSVRHASGMQHQVLYFYGIFISGLFIMGGITKKHLFYVAGLCLAFPIISKLVSTQYLFHMPIQLVINLIFISIILWLLLYKRPFEDKQAARRPNLVIHTGLISLGVLGIALCMLSAYNPGQAIIIRTWAVNHTGIILNYAIALVSLGYGLAFKAVRFMLYAVLISMSVIISEVFARNIIAPGVILSVLGIMITASGVLLLKKFLKRYPVLEEKQNEPAEV